MARSVSLNLRRVVSLKSASSTAARLMALRSQSNCSSSQHNLLSEETSSESTDPLIRRLEDAVHRIIVRRSAPDWLPFVPGSSYWVPPPRSRSHGIAQLVEKLVDPLSQDQSMSTTTLRGWPSSAYFIQGAPAHPVEGETITNNTSRSQSEDEEG